jgi:hypothetical protein
MAANEGRWISMLGSGLTGTSIGSLEVPVADGHILGYILKNLKVCSFCEGDCANAECVLLQ